jgi:DNA-binding response OmpR family regulator
MQQPVRKILVVDDSEDVRCMVAEHFARRNYEVSCAKSLKEGVQLALTERPGVILLDFNLPDGSGDTLIRQVKRMLSFTKVIVVTGMTTDPALEGKLLSEGADFFFTKGVSITDIQRKVDDCFLSI